LFKSYYSNINNQSLACWYVVYLLTDYIDCRLKYTRQLLILPLPYTLMV